MPKSNTLNFDTVALDDSNSALTIIDQTKLPQTIQFLRLKKQEEIFEAIYLLKVRGAPAIGVAAAIGIYLAAKEIKAQRYDEFFNAFTSAKNYLASSRPTAVNLFWALNRMENTVKTNKDKPIAEIKSLLKKEAEAIRDEDIWVCQKIGEYGLTLIKDGQGILTHCNAGRLAAVRYGTALAPIYLGLEKGMKFKVFTDETRPLLQGMRLSAFELAAAGIDVTVICDNMASQVMKNGWIDIVITGCDRTAANGDCCNKIGTSGIAILAKHYGIPFYIAAPTATIDMSIKSGSDIPIEQRPPAEITDMWFEKRMAPENVKAYNPAFDVTDNCLIAGIITEFGIARPPYNKTLQEIFDKKSQSPRR